MTAIVGSLLIGVTGYATDLPGGGFVRGALYIRVAIHAGKHAAVDGVFERLRIDVQGRRLAVSLMAQGGIAVAGETLIRSRFGRLFLCCGGKGSGC